MNPAGNDARISEAWLAAGPWDSRHGSAKRWRCTMTDKNVKSMSALSVCVTSRSHLLVWFLNSHKLQQRIQNGQQFCACCVPRPLHTHTHTVRTNLTKLQLWRRLYRSMIWDVTAPSGAFFILPNISPQMHNIQLKSQHLLWEWCGSDGCKNASLCTHCRLIVDIECMSHPLGLHICLCLRLVTDVALLVFGIIGKVTLLNMPINDWRGE